MESAVESLAFLLEAIKQEVADINLLGKDLTSAEKAKVERTRRRKGKNKRSTTWW